MSDSAPLRDCVNDAVLGSTLALRVSALPHGWRDASWFTSLTVTPETNECAGGKRAPPFCTARVHAGWLHLPRFRGMKLLGGCAPPDDRRSMGIPMNESRRRFEGVLREDPPQIEATRAVVSSLETLGGAMLVLPCGFGKTVCALWVVRKMARRTLVLVHTGALADQWAHRIATFLPDVVVGRIQRDVVNVEGCDVVVGMIQSLVRREYERDLLSTFGMVVVDEAHHIAAPWFGRALGKLSARYIVGLSATPDRKDGCGCILPWLLGDLAFRAHRETSASDAVVRIVEYVDASAQIELLDWRGKPAVSKMLTRLATDATRTAYVVSLIMQYVVAKEKEGCRRRHMIVLSQRRDQLVEIQRLLEQEDGCVCVTTKKKKRARSEETVEEEAAVMPRFTVGCVMGGTPPALRDAGFGATVLLSTYSYAAEGIDIPRLDTLVMASPGINIEQTVGRILRPHPQKQTPLIVDVRDVFSLFIGMGWKRYNFYASQNYTVRTEKHEVL